MVRFDSLRARAARRTLIGLAAGATALVSASSAAADAVSAAATPYQNATIAAALANNPAGTRVAPAVVSWDAGTVQMVVPSGPGGSTATLSPTATGSGSGANLGALPNGSRSSCPSSLFTQWSCVYNGYSWNGTMLEFQDSGYYQNLYQYGGTNWVTLSWSNTTGDRAWLNQNENHNNPGAELCMTPGGAGSNSFGPWSGDQWYYLSNNTSQC